MYVYSSWRGIIFELTFASILGTLSQDHTHKNDLRHGIPDSVKDGGKFVSSERVIAFRNKLIKFMENHIYPMENEFYKLALSPSRWTVHPMEEKLKQQAKEEGLWNLWIPVCILVLTFLLCLLFFLC